MSTVKKTNFNLIYIYIIKRDRKMNRRTHDVHLSNSIYIKVIDSYN